MPLERQREREREMKPIDQALFIMCDVGEGSMMRENKLLTEKGTFLFVGVVQEGVRIPVLEETKQLYLEVILGFMKQTC